MELKETDYTELIRTLHEGQMLPPPGQKSHLKSHVNLALVTGDFRKLHAFLERYPMLFRQAELNIQQAEYRKLDNPFLLIDRDDAREFLSGQLKLGYVNKHDDKFAIDPDELSIPMLILGPVGGGKSNLLKLLLKSLLKYPGRFNNIIPDLKREYRNLLNVIQNIWIFNNDTLRLNPLQKPDWISADDFIIFLAKIFTRSNFLVGTSENTLIKTMDKIYQKRGIHTGTENWPAMQDLYKEISDQLDDHKSYRYRDILLWLLNRLYPYMKHQIFYCSTGIPDRFWREENVVLELGMGVSDNMYAFLVSYLAGLRFLYNQIHGLTGQRLNTLFLVDEGRILLDADRNTTDFGESYITEIITKTREYGVGFIFASHEAASVNRTLRAIARIKIAFPLTDRDDVEFIEKSFGLNEEQRDHIYKIDRKGIAIASYGGYRQPFLLGIPYVDLGPQVSDEQVARHMAPVLAKLKHEIRVPEPTVKLPRKESFPPAAYALLRFLSRYPFSKVSNMNKAPGLSSISEVNKALAWLETNGFITREPHKVSRRGRKAHFAVLTNKAFSGFGYKPIPGKGSFEHKLYQYLILKKLRNDGLTPSVEGRIKGSTKSIDVLSYDEDGQIVAYEVTIHFKNLIFNITQDLVDGASEVVVVCKDKADLARARKIVKNELALNDYTDSVSFSIISDFFS